MVKYDICKAGQAGWERVLGCWASATIGPGSQQDIGRGNMQAVQLRALQGINSCRSDKVPGQARLGLVWFDPVWSGFGLAGFDRMGWDGMGWGKRRTLDGYVVGP